MYHIGQAQLYYSPYICLEIFKEIMQQSSEIYKNIKKLILAIMIRLCKINREKWYQSLMNYYFFFLELLYLFIYLFLAVLGLRFCARALSSRGKRGPLFIAVRGPLTIAASPVAEHRLQMRRLSGCGSRAQLLRGMWDLPRPGLEPVSPGISRQILNHCATREACL